MNFFNFHHHLLQIKNGIYNLCPGEAFPRQLFSFGIHPADIGENIEEQLEIFRKISKENYCVVIGECGLDALVNADEKIQEYVFTEQIKWANEVNKPVTVHCVRRFQQLVGLKPIAKVPMVVHGFNKNKKIAAQLLNTGFYLSFGKALLHNVSLQQTFVEFPLEKVFLETDNTDFDIKELYEISAKLKNISPEQLEEQINKNLKTINING